MKRLLLVLSLMLGLGSGLVLKAAITVFPYSTGFETSTDTAGWTFINIYYLTQSTQWNIDSATCHLGHRSLYISNDSGATTNYNGTASGYIIHTYQTFTFPATTVPTTYALSFNWKCQGHYAKATDGTVNVGDAFAVSLVPDATTIRPSITGTDYPTSVKTNRVSMNDGRTEFYGSTQWIQTTGSFVVPATGGTFKLLFTWRMGGGINGHLGACIDDLEVREKPGDTDCEAPATNLTMTLTGTDLVCSWSGHASTYDLIYYNAMDPSTPTTVSSIAASTYSIARSSVPEGIYSFRVRPHCPSSTGFWVDFDKTLLVYDPSGYCLDYLNFAAPGVTCGTGDYNNAFQNIGYIDHGYGSDESQQTVHYIDGEGDPIVAALGSYLPTKPPGALASVRCGNHTSPTAEGIRYSFHVGPEDGLLIFKYAVVVQSGNHQKADQPYFKLRIMDAAGNDLDAKCNSPAFYAPTHAIDCVPGDGWKYNPSIDNDPTDGDYGRIFWRDWTTIGLNLAPYQGQDIKIEISTYDCSASIHFGYCYFTMSCGTGDIQGISCGEHPSEFTVDEGFNYRWYKDSDPGTTLGTDQTYAVSANDTSLYHVDMIYKSDATCKYTLNAWALPRFPEPKYLETRSIHDCQTLIHLKNASQIIGVWDEDGLPSTTDTVKTEEDCDEIMWKINGAISYKLDTTVTVPGAGDTLYLELHATLNGGCEAIRYDTLYVPSILPKSSLDTVVLCDNELPYTYKGITIKAAGNYADTLVSSYGCDSISGLCAIVNKSYDITSPTDTLCYGDSLLISGTWVKTAGTYDFKTTSVSGCDSVVHQPVFVFPELKFTATGTAETTPKSGQIIITPLASCLKTQAFEVYVDSELKTGADITTKTDHKTTVNHMSGGTYKVWLEQGDCTSDTMLVVVDKVCLSIAEVSLPEVCGDCGHFSLPITVNEGSISEYKVTFDATSKTAGFMDQDSLVAGKDVTNISIPLPNPIVPNHYSLTLTFTDQVCPDLEFVLDFDVLYPSSIIAQRWNDVLGLNNNTAEASDANGSTNLLGGYTIENMEWYLNNQPTGVTRPLYYIKDNDLDFTGEYRVNITRSNDKVSVMSCGMTPRQYTDSELKVSGTLVLKNSLNPVSAPAPGLVRIYSSIGLLISTSKIASGENELRMPDVPGYYILHFELNDGTVANYSIQVVQ